MPLRDHFRPPLSTRRHWHSLHNAWATFLASALNQTLPKRYFAEPNVQFGIQIDVGTFEERDGEPAAGGWTPSSPALTIPFALSTDIVEVAIYSQEGGPVLVGAIELVSPANKDRPDQREAFVSKCETYLRQGLGLVIVDVVTERRANFHNDLLTRLDQSEAVPLNADLYATAYRPMQQDGQTQLEIWQEPLAVGGRLPTLPLWLRGAYCAAVDLEASYERTCGELRVAVNGV
jgi:hypothetical protein